MAHEEDELLAALHDLTDDATIAGILRRGLFAPDGFDYWFIGHPDGETVNRYRFTIDGTIILTPEELDALNRA